MLRVSNIKKVKLISVEHSRLGRVGSRYDYERIRIRSESKRRGKCSYLLRGGLVRPMMRWRGRCLDEAEEVDGRRLLNEYCIISANTIPGDAIHILYPISPAKSTSILRRYATSSSNVGTSQIPSPDLAHHLV